MAKGTWLNVGGTWKKITNVWQNVGGTWKSKEIPKLNVSSTWKNCIQYILLNITRVWNWVQICTNCDQGFGKQGKALNNYFAVMVGTSDSAYDRVIFRDSNNNNTKLKNDYVAYMASFDVLDDLSYLFYTYGPSNYYLYKINLTGTYGSTIWSIACVYYAVRTKISPDGTKVGLLSTNSSNYQVEVRNASDGSQVFETATATARAFVFDKDNNIYTVHYTSSTVGFFKKFDSTGNLVFTKSYATMVYDVAISPHYVYVLYGAYTSPQIDQYDYAGNLKRTFNATSAAQNIDADETDCIYDCSVGSSHAAVKYSDTGAQVWSFTFNNSGTSGGWVMNKKDGTIYVGFASGSMDKAIQS